MKKREYRLESLLYSNPDAQVQVFAASINQGTTPVVVKQTVHMMLEEANAVINEAMTQTKLEHENICKIIDCFLEETENRQFASILILERMKFDLANEITRRKANYEYWPENELLYSLYSLTKALSYAQSKDVSHRDIKPQNIFITDDGVLKLGDFGSATRQKALTQLTGVQGTPLFLSPELKVFYQQSFCDPAAMPNVDLFKSDVYSLGVTLLFMATLEAPAQLIDPKRLQEATAEAIHAVSGYPTFAWFLQQMLEIDPSSRISFQELESMLGNYFGEPAYPQPVQSPMQPDYGQMCAAAPNPQQFGTGMLVQQYEQSSNHDDYRTYFTTVTNTQAYTCSICGSYFLDPKGWQVIGDGNYICSEGCKKKYESYFCQKCNRQIIDYSWWSKAQQSYLEYSDQFQFFCSYYCLSTSLSQHQKIKCVWCQIPIITADTREVKIVQLDCLHVFHDIECVIKYISTVFANFANKTDFACPECETKIPPEIVEFALKLVEERQKGKTLRCQICNRQEAINAFKCKHILCSSCSLWEKKFWNFGKETPTCSVCKKKVFRIF